MAVQGRQGMTKALKKAARLNGMDSNRKRDKQSWRSAYHNAYRNAPGPSPMEHTVCGIIKPRAEKQEEVKQ